MHRAVGEAFTAYGGAAWAAAVQEARRQAGSVVVTAAGTPRGNEVLAHVAAREGVAMAANVLSFRGLAPFVVTRQVVGGAALEEMAARGATGRVHRGRPCGGAAARVRLPAPRTWSTSPPRCPRRTWWRGWSRPRSRSRTCPAVCARPGSWSAPVAGPAAQTASAGLLELADLLGGSLGVSRVVTSLGWRPHHEQVGQTGSRISPELYIPCGISGAIQHWAGCSSAKNILAINTDADAPMVTKATYAVIGDLHEVVPAINAEIRRRVGG